VSSCWWWVARRRREGGVCCCMLLVPLLPLAAVAWTATARWQCRVLLPLLLLLQHRRCMCPTCTGVVRRCWLCETLLQTSRALREMRCGGQESRIKHTAPRPAGQTPSS
jgi:hypothetical protein